MMPAYVKPIALVSMLLFLGVAVFGLITGIGLIRLKNWARISIIVFSGLTVFFGGTVLAFLLAMPFPTGRGRVADRPELLKGIVMFVYGLPVLISIWWLVLFSRKSTKAQFAGIPSESLPRYSDRPQLSSAGSVYCCPFTFFASLDVCDSFPANANPCHFFWSCDVRGGRETSFRAHEYSFGDRSNRFAEIAEMELPACFGNASVFAVERRSHFFQPKLRRTHAGDAVPNASAGKQRLSLFRSAASILLAVRPCSLACYPIGILIFYRRRFLEAAAARAALPRS